MFISDQIVSTGLGRLLRAELRAAYGPDLCCTTAARLYHERTGKLNGTHVIYPSARCLCKLNFVPSGRSARSSDGQSDQKDEDF